MHTAQTPSPATPKPKVVSPARKKFVAELQHVRETTLSGLADGEFWKRRLASANVTPILREGAAELLLIACEGRFMGVTFRELSFTVMVQGVADGAPEEGAFCLHAVNSSRFFAWCERSFFSTPYYYGELLVQAGPAPAFSWTDHGRVVLSAALRKDVTQQDSIGVESADGVEAGLSADAAAESRAALRQGSDGYSGPVFLPVPQREPGPPRSEKWFYAEVGGATRTYPFLPGGDDWTLAPTAETPVLSLLAESQFTPKEWYVRDDARHAKTKTFARSAIG